MDFLASTAAGKAADYGFSKFSDLINNIKGKHDDIVLADTIRQELLDRYGNEPFYNDFDSYLTHNNIINSLILTQRNSSPHQAMGFYEFVDKNSRQLIDRVPSCLAYFTQIEDAFSHLFNFVHFAITDINPYSDLGRLQSELRVHNAEVYNQLQTCISMLSRIQNGTPLLQNEVASQNLPDLSAEAEVFKAKIKEIETTYQYKSCFDDALTQYSDLALSIADAEIHGEAKSALLCALRCNIALCYSNLGKVKEAMDSLGKVPPDIAQNSETYNFVWASVVIQHKLEDHYTEALSRAEVALKLKPDYYRAFFFRQHLQALMGMRTQSELLDELDFYFSNISDEEKKRTLAGDYYTFRGLICIAFNDSICAYDNFEKATMHGYDELTSRFNLLSALYRQAIKDATYGERTLHPNVDIPKLHKVLDGLKDLLWDKRIDRRAYQDVKSYAISLYVSTSCTIKGSHDLQPLESFLPYSRDYETTRMLILGSKEILDPDTVQRLDQNDKFLLEIRQMLHDNDFQKCKETIEQHSEDSNYSLPADAVLTLLQLCIISKDVKSYRKYRNKEGIEAFAGDYLATMDACAYELEGDIEKAKRIFSGLVQTSTDYHTLENVLRFYKRSDSIQECEALYFKLQHLHKDRKTYIDDLDSFYCSGLDFMILQKRNSAKDFYEAAPKDELSSEAYSYMEERLYQAINDPPHLYTALSQNLNAGFQSKVNQAICQRLMCHYDDGLNLCLDLVQNAEKIGKEQLVKVYWLISDFYLFKKMLDESYSWALKAHKLMADYPYDQTHRAFLGRIMRSGHFEGLSVILDYQEVHPVVVNYIRAIQISPDEEDMPHKLLQQVKAYFPKAPNFAAQERQIAADYKKLAMPIYILFQCFGEDWGRLLQFAQHNKLRLGTGVLQRQQLEETWVGRDIVVDAQTLIIMAVCDCLPALQVTDHVHISYSSVAALQYFYLSNNYGLMAIDILMDWLNSEQTIIFEPDGIIDMNETFIKGFSKEFFACCNVSERLSIPFLCADALVLSLQHYPDFPISKNIQFITLPVFCKIYGKSHPDISAQMIYQLLQYGEFVSFSASTIFNQIKNNNFQVSEKLLQPFLICKSDYDMQSFSGAYLGAINMLREENDSAAEALSEIIIQNGKKIWKRGTYYRENMKRFPNDKDSPIRATSIFKYVNTIIAGIGQIWTPMPEKLGALRDELQETVMDELI